MQFDVFAGKPPIGGGYGKRQVRKSVGLSKVFSLASLAKSRIDRTKQTDPIQPWERRCNEERKPSTSGLVRRKPRHGQKEEKKRGCRKVHHPKRVTPVWEKLETLDGARRPERGYKKERNSVKNIGCRRGVSQNHIQPGRPGRRNVIGAPPGWPPGCFRRKNIPQRCSGG